MKKFYSLLLCVCLCSVFLTSCGEPKNNAATSVKAIYDLYILGNTDGVFSLGMSKEDIQSARSSYDQSVKETIRSNFSASGQEIEDDTLDELCSARKDALAKMKATAEVISESDRTATVVIHTTYFNESSLDEDAFYNAREAANQSGLTELQEQQVFLMHTYTQNLIAAYKNVVPSKDTTDITVECVIQDHVWVPANMSSFGSDLALAITGQNQE